LGLVEVLHPRNLSPRALTEWMARDLGAPPASRSLVDFGALDRIPTFLEELLEVSASRVVQAPSVLVS